MLWRFAILVLKALATLSRVILRIFSWKSEFIMFLTCSPSKSYLGLFGAGVFGFGSSWSVFSRNCIILLASNITRSFSGTKSMNWKFNITVIDKKTGPKVVCYHPKSIVPEVGAWQKLSFYSIYFIPSPRILKEANDLFCLISSWISGIELGYIDTDENTTDIENVRIKKSLNI